MVVYSNDIHHILNIACFKYTGSYLPADEEVLNEWKFKYIKVGKDGLIKKVKVGIPPSMPCMDYNTYNGIPLQVNRKIICDTINLISSIADKEYARDLRIESLCKSLNIYGEENTNLYTQRTKSSKYNLFNKKYKDDELINRAGKLVLYADDYTDYDDKISMLKQIQREKSNDWLYKDIHEKDRRWIELLTRYSFSGDPIEYHKLCRLVADDYKYIDGMKDIIRVRLLANQETDAKLTEYRMRLPTTTSSSIELELKKDKAVKVYQRLLDYIEPNNNIVITISNCEYYESYKIFDFFFTKRGKIRQTPKKRKFILMETIFPFLLCNKFNDGSLYDTDVITIYNDTNEVYSWQSFRKVAGEDHFKSKFVDILCFRLNYLFPHENLQTQDYIDLYQETIGGNHNEKIPVEELVRIMSIGS
tara:strand:+ start:193 stop:1446 length:1254 start_codon:yes stop_codon:yes gene_type:complete